MFTQSYIFISLFLEKILDVKVKDKEEKLGFSVPSFKIYFCLLDIHKSNSITRPDMERTVPIPPYLILTIWFHNLKVTIEQKNTITDTLPVNKILFVPDFLIQQKLVGETRYT